MTDTGDKPADEGASPLAALKTAAKALEKNVGGLPIEPEVLHDVVVALKGLKELPEPIVKGLAIVVACNGLNNVSKPSHAPFTILKLLLADNHTKTVEYFVSAVTKFFPTLPHTRKYALGRHVEFVNRWLLSSLCEVPKTATVPIPLVVDTIILSSVITFSRQGKRFPEDLFGVLRRYPVSKLLLELEKRFADGQDQWRVLVTLSVLFNVVNRNCERTPSAEHFQNQPPIPLHEELSNIAQLWFKVFVAFISTSPSYPGDQYISFINGQQLFERLPTTAVDSGFRSTLRKTFLKFPETALPAVCCMIRNGFKIKGELSEVLVELIQDSLSSNSDLIHQYTAILFPEVLYSADSSKRKLLLEKFLGKQGKVKNRAEYPTELQKFSESVHATYGGYDDTWLKAFVTDVETFAVTEIQAPKTDNASAPLAQILYGLRHHSQQSRKYFETAAQLLKLSVTNFSVTTTYGAAILASADYSSLDKAVFDALKDKISSFTNASTTADYVLFVTDLLLKLVGNGGDKTVAAQLFKSDAFMKDKFLTQLTTAAYQFAPTFVGDFVSAVNRVGDPKLTENSALVKFIFLTAVGPLLSKTVQHKVAQNFIALNGKSLSSILLSFTSFANSADFSTLLNKQLDASDPSNLREPEQSLANSTFLQTVPDILKEVAKTADSTSAEVVLSAILLLNNSRTKDEKALRNLSRVILETAVLEKIVYETFFTSGVIQKLYEYENLLCRQEAIGYVVSLESKNSQHRDFVWNHCAKLAHEINIAQLNEVPDEHAAIFFTPEDKLHNVAVIDEHSDLRLDGKQNIKRENKAYKFKDQLAEIELRKELAEKNRREGKLTQKQLDAVKKEMLKEKEIRDNLKPVYASCKKLTDILLVAIRADPNGSLQHYNIYYEIIVPSLKSPLASKAFYDCVKAYCNTFFRSSSDYLGDRALSALLRTFKSAVSVPEWKWEPYVEQISKMTSSMNMLCIMNNFLDDNAADALEQLQQEEESEEFNEGLTLGKLAFVLPIIEKVFNDPAIEDRVRKEVTNFLKAAFTLDFLTEEEKEWPPLSLLNEILLDAICGNKNGDYFEDIFSLLKRNLAELNRQDPSENVSQYVKKIVEQLHSPNEYVREHISILLNECPHLLTEALIKTDDFEHLTMIIISSNESVEQIRDISVALCNELDLHLSPQMHDYLLRELQHPYEFWQNGAAAALCGIFRAETVAALERNYTEWLNIVPAVYDNVGRTLSPAKDQWDSRRGVAIAFLKVITTQSYKHEDFESIMQFLVPKAIGDKHLIVRRIMFSAASELIAQNGSERVDSVLPHLENLLQNTPDGDEGDIVRNGLICLLGTLAQYLDPKSIKLKAIFARLISTLRTPSRQVQESVALCLPPLAKILHESATEELERLVRAIQQTPSFAERFGYAFGIAGLTKGLGLKSLMMIKFLPTMTEMFESKEANVREAAALLFLTMCFVHRNTFDPYVAKLLQMLIHALGDSDQTVRDAARDASATMMSSITPSAVKIFLPEILAGLDETNWRAKCASASFLGSISNCAPRQLSECLPRVVPSLANLITDSHARVQNAGMSAVKQIATVITNPEILAISSHLIAAVVEPAKETTRALRVIVNTRFIHFIDPPALAIMMPILKRALTDRDPEGRRMASNVVTNVFSIADEKDVEPYMNMLVPNLKHSLLDPSPEVRSAAAQAIGTVVKHNTDGIFTSYTTDLIPWLKERLMSRTSMVDRMGAAQGLAEVIPSFNKGAERVLKQAIEFTSNPENDPAMRDGYIRLFTYLPSTFGDDFIPYIELVVPAILSALADETEYLRDSALHAGQILIKTYCAQAKRHLLPCLLDGIINEMWRIRHAAVTLIGDFLFSISGISSKMTSDTAAEDDTFGMESANKTIVRYVGQKIRDRIIVSLYMARFDAAVQVRQGASHVWKLIVSNTPRTVKESLTPLYELIVHCIATSTEDRRVMGSECLGEVVRKMGERLMDNLMGEVQRAFEDSRADYRRGAVESLAVIINNVSTELIEGYTDEINKVFRYCLCDADNDLRQAAGETFAIYHTKMGISAFEDIVDPLFNDYAQKSSEDVLDGIVAILSVNRRGRVITVPSLIPRVLKFQRKSHVLCRLSEVAKDTIERNFIAVIDSLLDDRPEDADEIYDADCVKLIRCFQSNYVVAGAFKLLAQKAEKGNELAVRMMSELVKNAENKEDVISVFIEGILMLYCSEFRPIHIGGVKLFAELVSSCKPSVAMEIPFYLMSGIVGIKAEKRTVGALSVPGGWKPVIDLLAISSRLGSIDQRDLMLRIVTELLKFTEGIALRPIVPQIVGVLLRLLAEHCPTLVKYHAVQVVEVLLEKSPDVMRNFAPQLVTFLQRIINEAETEPVIPETENLLIIANAASETVKTWIRERNS